MSDTFDYDCRCYARGVEGIEPESYKWIGVDLGCGTLWAYFPACDIHDERYTKPVWAQRLGQLPKHEAASGELAAT